MRWGIAKRIVISVMWRSYGANILFAFKCINGPSLCVWPLRIEGKTSVWTFAHFRHVRVNSLNISCCAYLLYYTLTVCGQIIISLFVASWRECMEIVSYPYCKWQCVECQLKSHWVNLKWHLVSGGVFHTLFVYTDRNTLTSLLWCALLLLFRFLKKKKTLSLDRVPGFSRLIAMVCVMNSEHVHYATQKIHFSGFHKYTENNCSKPVECNYTHRHTQQISQRYTVRKIGRKANDWKRKFNRTNISSWLNKFH